jgi:hypothetical protein
MTHVMSGIEDASYNVFVLMSCDCSIPILHFQKYARQLPTFDQHTLFLHLFFLRLTGGLTPGFLVQTCSPQVIGTELTQCLKDVRHDLRILASLGQSDNFFPSFRHVRIEIKVNDLGDNLREKRCSGHNRGQKAASKAIQSAVP